MLKNIQIILTLLFALSFILVPQQIIAQAPDSAPQLPCSGITGCLGDAAGTEGAGYDTAADDTRLAKILGQIVRAFLSLIGIIFISYTIYGGFLWMTAAGNDEKMTKAKSIIRNGIIGLIVILSAAAIYALVNQIITKSN